MIASRLLGGVVQTGLSRIFGSRDRRSSRRREDYLRAQDRRWFEADRDRSEARADSYVQRLVADAAAAKVSPLAVLGGGQMSGPVTTFNSTSYPDYGGQQSSVPEINLDTSADEVNKENARLIGAQADLVEMQVQDAVAARLARNVTNEVLSDPHEITPQKHTPVLDHAVFGRPIKSDPTVADAESHTQRSGESELYEMLLNVIINAKDYLYDTSGLNWRQRMGLSRFKRNMHKDSARKQLERTGKQYYRFD